MSDKTSSSDRRESPRVPMRFRVRNASQGDFQEHEGDLSLGGIAYPSPPVPPGRYEIKFRLPNQEEELTAQGEPLPRASEGTNSKGVQMRFVDLDTRTELAIAKYLDDVAGTSR